MLRARIVGTGIHLPPRVQTAAELAPAIGVEPEWITGRTGVAERRISDRPMDEMAADAARQALGDGGPPDLLLNASLTPLQLIPDSSVFILDRLGLAGTPAFSVHATCLSFLVALHQAMALVHAGSFRRILVVSSEQGSVSRDMTQPESAALIGDGAAAAVVEPTPAAPAHPGDPHDSALLSFGMQTFPDGAALTELRGCGTRHHPNDPATTASDNLFQMSGPGVYKMALRRVPPLMARVLADAGCTPDDISVVVPHQASGPGMRAYQKLGFPPERIVDIIGTHGNCIAASIPMALHHAHAAGRLVRGERIVLLGTGAGLSVAAAVLRW